MRAVWTIAGKDFRTLLTSPLFYVISGLSSILWGYTFLRSIFMFAAKSGMPNEMGAAMSFQREVFFPLISSANLLFVFVVPALTMRLLSEEKRQRTYDLLLTSPITATQIALGKFFAGFGAIGVLTAICFLYPLMSRMVASFPVGPTLAAFLGVMLVSGIYVAVGLFASSLTESVMLSVVLGLIFNILLWFISQGLGESTPPWATAILENMSLGQHFINFIQGAIKLHSLVFMVSVITLFVFLTQRVIESSRWR